MFAQKTMRDYSLERVKQASARLGNPQNTYKTIHIAGTNGKGSVARMVFSVLQEANRRVGIFTSPHLVDIRERFQTQNGCISKEDFVILLNRIMALDISLSYFELCTLLAYSYFEACKCEYAIIEVGVG